MVDTMLTFRTAPQHSAEPKNKRRQIREQVRGEKESPSSAPHFLYPCTSLHTFFFLTGKSTTHRRSGIFFHSSARFVFFSFQHASLCVCVRVCVPRAFVHYMNFNGSFEINKYRNKGYTMSVNDSTAFY